MSSKMSGILRPHKMKHIELTVLSRDVDNVIEFLGRRKIMHFSENENETEKPETGSAENQNAASYKHIQDILNKLQTASAYLSLPVPQEPTEDSRLPGEAEETLAASINTAISSLSAHENEQAVEKRKTEEALNEAKAFSNLNAPFSDLDQLSYLTLRVGRLDPKYYNELGEKLADRAVIIPLDSTDDGQAAGSHRVLAAASRKGRFALDSELKRANFVPISIPEGYKGIPSELLSGLSVRLIKINAEVMDIEKRKEYFRGEYGSALKNLISSYLMAGIMEQLKSKVVSTKNVYVLSGWVPAYIIPDFVRELEKITEGRIAVRSYDPDEVTGVEGRKNVPVSLNHGAFVKGFEKVVFSYGAPLYGTIDPTLFVAVFFTILFGIMFGDLGQGMVLFLLGFLTGKKGLAALYKFNKFSVPLIAVGVSSMIMGLLTGEVFTNEEILVGPTRAVTGFFGNPVDRIITLMPLPEKGGSVLKLFYFFGFTLAIGVILNSIGLLVNIFNRFTLKDYEKALFDKTGFSGTLFFWYALFIAIRFLASMINPEIIYRFEWFDAVGLILPAACIFFGPVFWRFFAAKKPVFPEGLLVFIMEGVVEILETVSAYISNTVSFLRVGAFALSHAVLAYIVFRFAEEVSHISGGTAISLLIIIFGNSVIIVLEGMIVAIQVVRLQYYEFFSKFFTETGVEFRPFRFRKES